MKYVNLTVTNLPEILEEKAILTLSLEIREHWCVCVCVCMCCSRRRWIGYNISIWRWNFIL